MFTIALSDTYFYSDMNAEENIVKGLSNFSKFTKLGEV